MKKRMLFTFAMALFVIVTSSAQDLKEILTMHFETIGQEKLNSKKSLYVKGVILQAGMELPFEMINKRPDKYKLSIDVQGSKIVQAYDGQTVWAVNPLSGSSDPIELTGPEAESIIEGADLDGQLWKWKEKGHQLEFEGTEEIDGIELYVLKLSKKNGNTDYYYLDSDSYLITNTKSIIISQGSEIEIESILGNYQEMEGYLIPYSVEQRMNGQVMMTMKIKEIEIDNEYDDAIFSK